MFVRPLMLMLCYRIVMLEVAYNEIYTYMRKHVIEQAKGSDAAATLGTEAAVYAAEASDKHDLLERILPVTVSDYVDLVKIHIDAGGLTFSD